MTCKVSRLNKVKLVRVQASGLLKVAKVAMSPTCRILILRRTRKSAVLRSLVCALGGYRTGQDPS